MEGNSERKPHLGIEEGKQDPVSTIGTSSLWYEYCASEYPMNIDIQSDVYLDFDGARYTRALATNSSYMIRFFLAAPDTAFSMNPVFHRTKSFALV
ncbi:hypothetical protein UA08_06871 [Talaromyces atroroseus]|uniref:Uncharacterized protein n=1 Tax=Talaromyces atroroseus TaxID=1441469 RepID=A0A225AT98_TALAT|nr:hypothetical protein UA08_06871 [Talaromyces atroroseus]OKL58176.1 hypothetical protein UA08_06871 [Talaromyces atroroseus]